MTEQQRIICDKWKSQLAKYVAEHDLNIIVMPYIKAVVEKDLPVILGLNHLSSMMQLDTDTLKRMIVSSHSFYHSFTIPKRKGGTRQIDAPYPSMIRAQQWIYHEILSKVTISPSATGFIPHHSIKDNASAHLNQRSLLLLDVKDFFPSIKWHKVYAVFSHLGYPKIISQYLASLCCLNGHAPQGAVTSPALSNVIARRLDARITGLAKKYQVIYTRYADDMTFSGECISKRFQSFINKIVDLNCSHVCTDFPLEAFLDGGGLRYTYEGEIPNVDGMKLKPGEIRFFQGKDKMAFDGLPNGQNISVYSLDGKLLKTQTSHSGQQTVISLTSYPTGTYIVKVGDATYKFQKQ